MNSITISATLASAVNVIAGQKSACATTTVKIDNSLVELKAWGKQAEALTCLSVGTNLLIVGSLNVFKQPTNLGYKDTKCSIAADTVMALPCTTPESTEATEISVDEIPF